MDICRYYRALFTGRGSTTHMSTCILYVQHPGKTCVHYSYRTFRGIHSSCYGVNAILVPSIEARGGGQTWRGQTTAINPRGGLQELTIVNCFGSLANSTARFTLHYINRTSPAATEQIRLGTATTTRTRQRALTLRQQ